MEEAKTDVKAGRTNLCKIICFGLCIWYTLFLEYTPVHIMCASVCKHVFGRWGGGGGVEVRRVGFGSM